MATSPIILVPGFWLGAWAWDDVAALLRADGHDVTALTLPGLESLDADRSGVTMRDHVDAICAAVTAAAAPGVLAVHSGAGYPGYAASDRVADRIAAMVYVDTGPGVGAMQPDFEGADYPLPAWEDLEENLDGISESQLATFRERAVPEPGGALREAVALTNDARRSVPTTMVCTAFSADEYRDAAAKGYGFVAGLADLTDVSWVELPTSHWPMWSKPAELAAIIDEVATSRG
jgi:pimeloyl-ACP methyl ester carboxylesterase